MSDVGSEISKNELTPGATVDLSNYQTKEDNTLTTTSKTIVEAINKINASLKQLLEKQ